MANANDMDTVWQTSPKTENEYLRVIEEAEREGWCVMLWCATCYAEKFRSAVKGIPNLQSAMETLDVDAFIAHRDWYSMLRITAMDHSRSLDWEAILRALLACAPKHLRFADVVLYHIAAQMPRDSEARSKWMTACIELALRTRYAPLLESLVRILGPSAKDYENLLETALEAAPTSNLLKDALAKAGFTPSDKDVRHENKRNVEGMKLFGAIQRRDIRAVQALIAKRAEFRATDADGRTPLEYATFLGLSDIAELIESASAH